MKIVTSGSRYIDIDAYAGCIAYSYLLNLRGFESKAVTSSPINGSVTKSILNFEYKLDNYVPVENDEFIILDVSHPDFLDKIVKSQNVIEIIDHHTGYEDFWNSKLGNSSRIEFIGSVATIIVEDYIKYDLLKDIPLEIAYLLMAAILDNTLALKASITTPRDIKAYKILQELTSDTGIYAENYFRECQSEIELNFEKSILEDTKIGTENKFLPNVFSQLTLWDSEIIFQNKDIFIKVLNTFDEDWISNIISLKDGKSYIFANSRNKNIEELFNKTFDSNNILELDNVWLRKEIIKKSEL